MSKDAVHSINNRVESLLPAIRQGSLSEAEIITLTNEVRQAIQQNPAR